MRILVRVLLGLVLLLAVAVGALAVFLPGMVDSPAFRQTVEETTEASIGRPLQYDTLSVGLLPPRVELAGARIAGETPADPPLLSTDGIALRLAIAPLFAGVVLVDSLVIEGAELHLVQTADGLLLPEPLPAEEIAAETEEAAGAPVDIAVREVRLIDARITYEDRTVSPVRVLSVQPLEVTARGTSPDAPIALEASARFDSGGGFTLKGEATLEGALDLAIELDAIDLAPAASLLEKGDRLAATLDGRIDVRGTAEALDVLAIALLLDVGELQMADLRAKGPVSLDAKLAGPVDGLGGDFEIDATGFELASGDSFRKPKGVRASVAGRLRMQPSGAIGIDLRQLALAGFEATGRVDVAEATTLRLDAKPFDLSGWGPLLPAVEPYEINGSMALTGFSVVTEPLTLGGRIDLPDLRLQIPDAGVAHVSGAIVGIGDGVRLDGFVLESGGQRIGFGGRLTDLAGAQHFEATVKSQGVLRVESLLSALSGVENTLFGPLELDGQVAGALAAGPSETALTDSLTGRLSFDIGQGAGDGKEGGRLEGVDLLRTLMGSLDTAGSAALRIGARAGGVDIERYYGEDFERMDGRFEIGGGQLETKNLRIVYQAYALNLRGRVSLADQRLDMRGELALAPEAVKALGADTGGKPVVVPLASVGGTAAEPEFSISNEAVQSLASQLVSNNVEVQKAKKRAGSELGKLINRGLRDRTKDSKE